MATIGFLSGAEDAPASPARGSARTSTTTSLGTIDPDFPGFRRPWYATAFVRGIGQAVAAINAQRDLCVDLEFAIGELLNARPGIARNAAEARLAGYVWAISGALQALAQHGVRLHVEPPDQDRLVRELEKHNGTL